MKPREKPRLSQGSEELLPLELLPWTEDGSPGVAEHRLNRAEWFRERDIHPQQSEALWVEHESAAYHGIPSKALDRALVRSVGLGRWRIWVRNGRQGPP